jgi:hypothetical protein
VSHTDFEDGAFVAHIFLSNPQRNRLHAFEPAPRIEKRALLAGMQFEATLWTFALSRDALQNSPALRAARHCSGSWKIYRFGSERVIPARRTASSLLRRLLAHLVATRFSATVLISWLTVFGHHSPPRPCARIVHPMPVARQVGDAGEKRPILRSRAQKFRYVVRMFR